MKIVFTGGGTGGHIFPLVAVVREIRNLYPKKDLQFIYIGPEDEFGSLLLAQEDIKVKKIAGGKVRRYFSFLNVIDILFKIPWSFIQSFFLLMRIDPQLVFSKGGSGSVPVALCASLLRIPVFIHESDVVPGASNRIASRWAKRIFISFPRTEFFDPEKVTLVGNPIRSEILGGSKDEATDLFDLTLKKPVLLFSGGSQGAEAINDFVLRVLNGLLESFEVIHLCGFNNLKNVQNEAQVIINADLEKYYHPYAFLDEEKLRHAYRAAELVISRAGSGCIFEIAALGLPSILVPLPWAAGDHQARNAFVYAETGAAIVMEQDNLTPNFFLEKVRYLFAKSGGLDQMKEQAIRFAKPLAAKAIARNILEYLTLE
ncbi:MAG: undecaprenyldiphospho-muramoylpentapeptide beta-N-acetylglucosaminyltransferase [Candidatus Staskawiczbacteria bacterium]|jgi:UDP-N-acetylglucosamine--N-acetylmuramyl-(pentapeptide) pyrophosphoryl-undecaprenol N-acetylglucosamine transferase